MDTGKWDAFEYAVLIDADNPLIGLFADRVDYWFDGYQYFDGTDLIRDEIPYDPADPLSAPFEAAMSLADPRVSTYVVVVDRDEVDRTASGIPSTHPWDILLDLNGNPTGDTRHSRARLLAGTARPNIGRVPLATQEGQTMMQPNAGINIPADAPSWAVTLMVQNAQAVDDLKGMVREMDGKFDQHIAEGAEVKADIAVLKNAALESCATIPSVSGADSCLA